MTSVQRLLLSALLCLCAAVRPAGAQDVDPAMFNGSWNAEYADIRLGKIAGAAQIDMEAGSATLTYRHPETGEEFPLVSESFRRDGATLWITFAGQSPAAPADDGLGYPVIDLVVPEQQRTATASIGGPDMPITIAPRIPSDAARVDLELTLNDDQTLIGSWHYRADPFTRRARDGLGRIGLFEFLEDGGGRQSGSEIWTRPIPKIVTAFSLSAQLGWNFDLDQPAVPYPFQDDAYAADSTRRLVAIAGYDLPKIRSDPVRLDSLSPTVSYGRMIDADSTFQTVAGHADPIGTARDRVAESFAPTLGEQHAAQFAASLDYLIVESTIRKEVVNPQPGPLLVQTEPGLHRFMLNGETGGWNLVFSNNGAQIRFVRPIDPSVALRRRFDSFDILLRNADATLTHARLRIEVNDLVDTGGVAPAGPLWLRSGERLTGTIDSATFYTVPPDTRERIASAPGMGWLRERGDATVTGEERVLRPGNYRGQFGTFTIDATGAFTYDADPLAWSSIGQEPTEHLFAPEVFRIAVRTDVILPRSEIKVILGDGQQILQIDGARQIAVRRDSDDPRLYYSDPIFLPPAGQGRDLAVPTGARPISAALEEANTLFATIADPGLISVLPPPAKARVSVTPARMEEGQSFHLNDGPHLSFLWKEHLQSAHGCYDDLDPIDWDRSDFDFVATLEADLNFEWYKLIAPISLLFSSETLTTDFQLGDHAALLLLRDAFGAQLRPRLDEYRRLATADRMEVAAFWISLNPYAQGGSGASHPLNDHRFGFTVPMPNGTEEPFFFTFHHNASSSSRIVDFNDPAEVPLWIVEATRSALGQYVEAIEESLAEARDIDRCEVEDLVKLVGAQFNNVEDFLLPRLMRLSDGPQLIWEPDYHGRLRIRQVASKLWQVRAHQRLSEADTDQIVMIGTVVTIPFGGIGTYASLAMLAVNTGVYLAVETPRYLESQTEIAFARGAAETLGDERYLIAERNEYHTIQFVAGIAITMLGDAAGNNILKAAASLPGRTIEIVKAAARSVANVSREKLAEAVRRASAGLRRRAIRAGEALVNADDFDLARIVSGARPRDSEDLAEFLSYALQREAAGETLEPGQQAALNRLRALNDTPATAPADAFTGELSVLRDIAPARADLRQLVAEAGDLIRGALAAGGRMRSEALGLLRYTAQTTGERFQAALNARVARLREPLGQDFFHMTAPENRAVSDLLEQNGWAIGVEPGDEPLKYNINIAAPGGFEDEIIRGFDPDSGVVRYISGFRNEVPGHIDIGLPQAMTNRGVPTFLFAQLRFLNEVGVGFAGQSGHLIRRVDMDWVLNARTNVQLTWFRNTYYPGRSFASLQEEGLLDEFVLHTRAVDYARTVINMAGYRVQAARFVFDGDPRRLWSLGRIYREAADGESWEDFLRRYNLGRNSLGPPNFAIEIDVVPFSRSGSGSASPPDTIRFDIDMPPEATQRLTLEMPPPRPDASETVELTLEMPLPRTDGAETLDDVIEPPSPRLDGETVPPPAALESGETFIERQPLLAGLSEDIGRLRDTGMIDLRNQMAGAGDRIAELDMAANMLRAASIEEQGLAYGAAGMMRALAVPEHDAIMYAALHFRRPVSGALGSNVLQAQLVAEAVYWRGVRPVPLTEFMEATGLPESAARLAMERAARRWNLVYLPGEIRQPRFLPPEFR